MDRSIHRAREAVRAANHQLDGAVWSAIQTLTDLPATDLRTPEYGKAEYLLNCTETGSPVAGSASLLSDISATPLSDPPWIKVVGDQILVLRWLAHFLGFRHRAVHLFLDHPEDPDYTFIQIRSLSKYNQPGLYDMPVAGHVDGVDSPRDTLRAELQEELGLDDQEGLIDVEQLATYNIAIPDFQPNYDEVEHTTLYRAKISPEALSKIRLQEGELGGLVLFRKDELTRWFVTSPDRFGGGLIDSWKYYVDRG